MFSFLYTTAWVGCGIANPLSSVQLDTNMRIWKKYKYRDMILCVLRVFVATNNTSYNFNRNNNCNLWLNYCCFFPPFFSDFTCFPRWYYFVCKYANNLDLTIWTQAMQGIHRGWHTLILFEYTLSQCYFHCNLNSGT